MGENVKFPGFFKPTRDVILYSTRTVDKAIEDFGEFVLIDFDVGCNDEALAARFESKNELAQDIAEGCPVFVFELFVCRFDVERRSGGVEVVVS